MLTTLKEGRVLLQFGPTQGWESFGEVCGSQKTQEEIPESAEGSFSLIQLKFSNFHRPSASISGGDE